MESFNPAGSVKDRVALNMIEEAEKSGNGLRIFSKYLYDHGFTSEKSFSIETPGGLVRSEIIEERNGKAYLVKVDMGTAVFDAKKVPVNI